MEPNKSTRKTAAKPPADKAPQEPASGPVVEKPDPWKVGETREQFVVKDGKRYPIKVTRRDQQRKPIDLSQLPLADEAAPQ